MEYFYYNFHLQTNKVLGNSDVYYPHIDPGEWGGSGIFLYHQNSLVLSYSQLATRYWELPRFSLTTGLQAMSTLKGCIMYKNR